MFFNFDIYTKTHLNRYVIEANFQKNNIKNTAK